MMVTAIKNGKRRSTVAKQNVKDESINGTVLKRQAVFESIQFKRGGVDAVTHMHGRHSLCKGERDLVIR